MSDFPGIPRTTTAFVAQSASATVTLLVGVTALTLPALVVVLAVAPQALPYYGVAVAASVAFHAASSLGEVDEPAIDEEAALGDAFQTLAVLYLLLAVPLSASLLVGASVATYLAYATPYAAASLLVAALLPVADALLTKHLELSLFVLVLTVLVGVAKGWARLTHAPEGSVEAVGREAERWFGHGGVVR